MSLKIYSDMRWPDGTGIGHVMQALASRFSDDFEVIDIHVQGKIGSPLSPFRVSHALGKKVDIGKAIFWSAGFIPPAYSSIPSVVTIHDLIHLKYYSKAHKLYYDCILKKLYKRCDAIVTVSESSRNELIEWSKIPAENIHVISNGVDDVFFESGKTLNLPFSYILYAGNYRDYKNIDRLIAAYSKSLLPTLNVNLAITGDGNSELVHYANRFGVIDKVKFLGKLNKENLVAAYRGALSIVFVSLYEGFGLPILEGMAVGIPVVTSNVSAMAEIAGDSAYLVDPVSVDSIVQGLNDVTFNESLREQLRIRGKKRVSEFSWNESARKLEQIFLKISSSRARY